MKTVTVKDLVIGTGAPKIIVSLMAKDIASVKSEALAYREADFDILEWRVDHFADLSNVESVMAAAKILRETMPEKPLLFTFRSAKEGGEQAISTEAYIALNRAAIDSGLVDMIDLELFTGDDQVKETVAYAHAHDVKVVMSNHDFHKTPEAEEIIARLRSPTGWQASWHSRRQSRKLAVWQLQLTSDSFLRWESGRWLVSRSSSYWPLLPVFCLARRRI